MSASDWFDMIHPKKSEDDIEIQYLLIEDTHDGYCTDNEEFEKVSKEYKGFINPEIVKQFNIQEKLEYDIGPVGDSHCSCCKANSSILVKKLF